ncbi:MAG TPA: FkbM family methyltransferase [Ohtaekwangia sp.]|uniref:FkbM family methyltransferase n=1 Tax=Ohtaekwangia sp. TaxID=2066019 RepID=UPI002F934190
MLRSGITQLFRSLNANLLYPLPWLVEKFLKVMLVISERSYRSWMKQPHEAEQIVVRNIDKDIIMKVDTSKAMGAAFYWMGFHELNEWRFLNRFLKSDMVFIDIGANQGEFSLFAAKRLTQGRVLAFEPVDFFYDLLQENIGYNHFKNIETFHYGLSNEVKQLPIYMGQTGAGEHEGLATIFQSDQRARFIQNIELKILDEQLPALALQRIDFMKIDVEGAEMLVLKGALKTIERFKPLIMLEINEATYLAAGYTVPDVIQFFSDLGYTLHIMTKSGTLKPVSSTPAFCNAVFVPKGK